MNGGGLVTRHEQKAHWKFAANMVDLGRHRDDRQKCEIGKQEKTMEKKIIMMMTQVSGGGNPCSRFIETVDLG